MDVHVHVHVYFGADTGRSSVFLTSFHSGSKLLSMTFVFFFSPVTRENMVCGSASELNADRQGGTTYPAR